MFNILEAFIVNLILKILISIALVPIGAGDIMAIEEAKYKVVRKSNNFEIRDYAPHIIAETVVGGNLEDAGNKAFRVLFDYISGGNRSRMKVDMTAPVSQRANSEKIKMTAPVSQRRSENKWAVSFMMPASYTMKMLPKPENPRIVLRQIKNQRMATLRYTGLWSQKGYLKNKLKLETWIRDNGLNTIGDPIWARYNSPFTPWFLRRNEILIPIASDANQNTDQANVNSSQNHLLNKVL